MTYKEKLLDPRWQKKRLGILQRDNWRCTNCSDNTTTLHVHHLDYERNTEPWEYPESYLTTLCAKCHSEYEETKHKDETDLLKLYRLRFINDFTRSCLYQILQDINIDNIVYMLWDLGIEESNKLLTNALQEKSAPFFAEHEQGNVTKDCPACNNNEWIDYKEYNSLKCTLCGYVKEYGKNTISQA